MIRSKSLIADFFKKTISHCIPDIVFLLSFCSFNEEKGRERNLLFSLIPFPDNPLEKIRILIGSYFFQVLDCEEAHISPCLII